MTRLAAAVTIVTALAASGRAQPVNLTEKAAPGDRATYGIELDLKGELFVIQEGKKESLPVQAKARHIFAERVVAVSDGLPTTTARYYHEAVASVVVVAEKMDRSLPADRRLIVARRTADGLTCFALAGPLSRDDLDLVSEHFNPQCLPGLLPGKVVNVGETWTVGDTAVQIASQLDVVTTSQLIGKLTAIKDGVAAFTVEGTAEGTEGGAKVKLTVTASGTFDLTSSRITTLTWKQKDQRDQGPVNPASQVDATITLRREVLSELPKQLSDVALTGVPTGDIPARFTELRYVDPKGRYTIVHPRDWHITGQTDTHLVLRLLERGEFIAQATVSVWRKAEPGKHVSPEEFRKAAGEAPGWTPTKVVAEGELPAGAGRWLYHLTLEGKMENLPVVQTFYLLAGPRGDQVAVTVAMKPEKARAVSDRATALVHAIEFGKK